MGFAPSAGGPSGSGESGVGVGMKDDRMQATGPPAGLAVGSDVGVAAPSGGRARVEMR
jgi:hypothetical protein